MHGNFPFEQHTLAYVLFQSANLKVLQSLLCFCFRVAPVKLWSPAGTFQWVGYTPRLAREEPSLDRSGFALMPPQKMSRDLPH